MKKTNFLQYLRFLLYRIPYAEIQECTFIFFMLIELDYVFQLFHRHFVVTAHRCSAGCLPLRRQTTLKFLFWP